MESYLYKKAVEQIWPKVNYLSTSNLENKTQPTRNPRTYTQMCCTDCFRGVNTPTMPASKLPCDVVKMD